MSATAKAAAAAPASTRRKLAKPEPPENPPVETTPAPDPAITTGLLTPLVSRRLPGPKPELQPFARKVREAMLDKRMSASDLARAVWGTATDFRGYKVARNRDRIGHYLAGVSYPEPDNLKKLAEALGLPIEELVIDDPRPEGSGLKEGRAGMLDTQIIMLNAYPGVCTVQLRRLMSVETAMKIMRLIQEDVLPESARAALPSAPEGKPRET
jgi:transcriptional regulator with XRE-family HTH domain